MKLIKFAVLSVILLVGSVSCGKLKFVAFKGPHFGFAGVKVRTPKFLGLGHGLKGGHHGGFGGGGFHSSGYEHHEYHESHHSSGGFGGGGGLWGK